jgi:hypothetical protein
MAMRRSAGTVLAATSLASTTRTSIDITGVEMASVQVIYSDTAPAAKTFLDANVGVVANTVTITGHPYVVGCKVAASTDGTLPGGLSSTNYWVIVVDADTIKLASSLAFAVAGTPVDITSAAGGGTHTLTAATSSGNVAKLQVSNDNTNWSDVSGDTVTIATSSGAALWDTGLIASRYMSVLYTPSAGQVSLAIKTCTVAR